MGNTSAQMMQKNVRKRHEMHQEAVFPNKLTGKDCTKRILVRFADTSP